MKSLVALAIRALGYRVERLTAPGIRGRDLLEDVGKLMGGKADPLCFDVGANRGQTISSILEHFPRATVFAFEPSEELHRELAARYEGGRVRCFNLALGEAQAQGVLNLYGRDNLNSMLSLSADDSNPFRGESYRGTQVVHVQCVDNFCDSQSIHTIDLLKTDTQGYDLHVLKGARRMLEDGRIGAILAELNFARVYDGQDRVGELIDFLGQCGYFPVDLYNKRRVPYHPTEKARSVAWHTEHGLEYDRSRGRSISWCDGLFARPGWERTS